MAIHKEKERETWTWKPLPTLMNYILKLKFSELEYLKHARKIGEDLNPYMWHLILF